MPTTNGKEQVFNFGIKNNDPRPADTTADFLKTQNADGTEGKIDPEDLGFAIDAEVVHKTGDTFILTNDFDPLLSQSPTDLTLKKRDLQPETTHLTVVNSPIFAWGDSLTAGAGGTPYPTTLQGLIFSTVTNKGIGGETSTQIKDRLVLDTANYSKSVIIWAGRNNYTSPSTVKADIATMISTIGHDRYLVVGIINGDYPTELINQSGWTTINTLNTDLKTLYGNKFIDIRPYLVSLHGNSAQDLADFANDIPPTSLRSDALHLNTAGYNKVAEFINQRLGYLYNQTGYLQSKDINYYISSFGIANQGSLSQTANFNISGAGIINRIISRAGTNASVGTALHHVFQTTGGSNRFALGQTTVEAGSNSGSNLNFVSFNDAGAVHGIPLTFFRSNNHAVFQPLGVALAVDNGYLVDVNGSFRASDIYMTVVPATSAGSYDIITRNTSTGKYEKIGSNVYATLSSPALTGTPTAPTATAGTNTTQLATTAFVQAAITSSGTYTPVCSNNSNFGGGVVNRDAVWTRTGNIVNVKFDFVAGVTTAGTSSNIDVTLPFTVATGDQQYIGSGSASISPYANCYIQANSGATVCTLYCTPSVTTSARYVANITYVCAP